MLGEETGYVLIVALLGLALSVGAHLYQGAWAMPFHILFHGIAVLLVLSPLGLWACFGLHIAGDCVPVFLMKNNMKAWAERERSRIRSRLKNLSFSI